MKENYRLAGLNYDLIHEAFYDMNEFDRTFHFYLEDENFKLLGKYLEDEDYAMAKDACKGLYVLAGELRVFPLYETLLEVYEDLEAEMYAESIAHYEEMIKVYDRIRSAFYA